MSRIQRKLQTQIEGVLLSAIAVLLLIACAGPRAHAVIITDGDRFTPATLSIAAGEKVVWRNRSPDRHQIVLEQAPAAEARVLAQSAEPLRSGDLYHNQEWSHTFEQPGAYRFVCAIHGDEDMVGALMVDE